MDRLPSSLGKGDLTFTDAERLFETEMIVKALKRTGYVQTKAAELLGISRRILKYKMDKLNIRDESNQSENVRNTTSTAPVDTDLVEGEEPIA
jgi:transcriptional regulator with GAF, ATPase, and Fis domain